MKVRVIVVMGVSGAGKSHVGRMLAARLGWDFADADDYHPAANVAKMRAGVPLDDRDREPWLEVLNELARNAPEPLVLACSALKQSYRDTISAGLPDVKFVFLNGSFEAIRRRLGKREGHYMPASLLQSQFDALEAPDNALELDCLRPAEELVDDIIAAFRLFSGS